MNFLNTVSARTVLHVLETSWQAAVLAAVVVVLGLLLREKLSARWRCALWLVVVARLLMPVAPESPVSLFNLFPVGLASTTAVAPPAETFPPVETMTPLPMDASFAAERSPLSADAAMNAPAAPPVEPVAEPSPWWTVENVWLALAVTWLLGTGVALTRILVLAVRLRLLLRRCAPVDDPEVRRTFEATCRELGMRRRVGLVASPAAVGPAVAGAVRPKMIVSDAVLESLSSDELRLVFLHELSHVRRHDLVIQHLWMAAQTLHWFNPVVWLAARRWQADRELACDEAVLARLDRSHQAGYGRAILRVMESLASLRPVPGAVGVLTRRGVVARRITMIARYRPLARRWTFLAAGLLLLLIPLGLTNAEKTEPRPSGSGVVDEPNNPTGSLTVAAREETPPASDEWGPERDGLRTRVVPAQEQYVVGGPITVRVELKNVGDRERSYDAQQVHVNGSMLIRDPHGKILPYVGGSFQTFATIDSSKPLAPGQTEVLFDGLDLTDQYLLVEPGVYTIEFRGTRAFPKADPPIPPSNRCVVRLRPGALPLSMQVPARLIGILPSGWTMSLNWRVAEVQDGRITPPGWQSAPGTYVSLVRRPPNGLKRDVLQVRVWVADRELAPTGQNHTGKSDARDEAAVRLGRGIDGYVYCLVPNKAEVEWPSVRNDIKAALRTNEKRGSNGDDGSLTVAAQAGTLATSGALRCVTFDWDILGTFDHFAPVFDQVVDEGRKGTWNNVLQSLENDPDGPRIDLRNELFAHLGRRVTLISDRFVPASAVLPRALATVRLAPEGSTRDDRLIFHPEGHVSIVSPDSLDPAATVRWTSSPGQHFLFAVKIKPGKARVVDAAMAKIYAKDPTVRRSTFEDLTIWTSVDAMSGVGSKSGHALDEQEPQEKTDSRRPLRSSLTIAYDRLLFASSREFLMAMLNEAKKPGPVQRSLRPDSGYQENTKHDSDEKGTITIAGRCVDEKGLPVAGADVMIHERRSGSELHGERKAAAAKTDEQGVFRFTDLPAPRDDAERLDRWQYVVRAKKAGRASTGQFVPPENLAEADRLVLKMPPGASLTGQVTNEAGKPVEGAVVRYGFYALVDEGISVARTDAQGHFEMNDLVAWGPKKNCDNFCTVHHPDFVAGRVSIKQIPLAIKIVAQPAATIEGRVVDTVTDRPAAGVSVSLQATDRSEHYHWDCVSTDADGKYRFQGVPSGKFNIWPDAKDRTAVAIDSFAVQAGQKRRAPNLELIEGGFIEGRVMDAETGKSLARTATGRIHVGTYGPARPRSGAAVQGTTVDGAGWFRLRVPPGTYSPHISGNVDINGMQPRGFDAGEVEVEEGATRWVEFHVLPLGHDLEPSGPRSSHTYELPPGSNRSPSTVRYLYRMTAPEPARPRTPEESGTSDVDERATDRTDNVCMLFGRKGATKEDAAKLLDVIARRLKIAGIDLPNAPQVTGDGQVEVLVPTEPRDVADRVLGLLAYTGVLEFRILANPSDDKDPIERAPNEPGDRVLDKRSQRLVRWMPVSRGQEETFTSDPHVVTRTSKQDGREVVEVLVVKDSQNVTDKYLSDVRAVKDEKGRPCVEFHLTEEGGKRLAALTRANLPDREKKIYRRLGVLFGGDLYSAPVIQDVIHNRGQITGAFTQDEVDNIVAVLGTQILRNQATEKGHSQTKPPAAAQEADSATEMITLAGRCVDEKNKPVAGAEVVVFGIGGSKNGKVAEATTDDKGEFHFDSLPAPRTSGSQLIYTVLARKPGRASAGVYVNEYDLPPKRLRFKMPPAARLSGRVIDVAGKPIEGALVGAIGLVGTTEEVFAARTDSRGRFAIDDFFPWDLATSPVKVYGGGTRMTMSGSYSPDGSEDAEAEQRSTAFVQAALQRLFVRHPYYAASQLKVEKIPSDVIVILRPAAVIEGRVIDAGTSLPVAGIVVSVRGTSKNAYQWSDSGVSDRDGYWRVVALPAGEYNVQTQSPARPSVGLTLHVLEGQTKRSPDLRLVQGGLIEGRVVDAQTGKAIGKSVAGMGLIVAERGPSGDGPPTQMAAVDENGRFRLHVLPGRAYPRITDPELWKRTAGRETFEKDGVEVNEGQTVTIEFRVKAAGSGQKGGVRS